MKGTSMDILRVKRGDKVKISYFQNPETTTVESVEPPRSEFEEAFERIDRVVEEEIGKALSDNEVKANVVRFESVEVSVTYSDGEVSSYGITGNLEISNYDIPMETRKKNIKVGAYKKLDEAVMGVLNEAKIYLSGDRSQGKLVM